MITTFRKTLSNDKLSLKDLLKKLNEEDSGYYENLSGPNGKKEKGMYRTIQTPANDFEKLQNQLAQQEIFGGIGIGSSNDEMIARSQALSEARAYLAATAGMKISRYREQYAKNLSDSAQKIWEEKANAYTNKSMQGITEYKTVSQYDKKEGKYRIYTFAILNPCILRDAIEESMRFVNDSASVSDIKNLEKQFESQMSSYQKIWKDRGK